MVIRPPAVSGTFYPADPTLLMMEVDAFLDAAEVEDVRGTIVGLVAPHAGYMYSGRTAGYAYALLRGKPIETAVIVSPSHREYFKGISVYDGDAYRTPLGIVDIDDRIRRKLLGHRGVVIPSRFGHRMEHAVEVHLPFLQRVNNDIRIVPLVMGDQRGEYCFLLGRILSEVLSGEQAVLIASSDLSHMHTDEEARRLDAVAAEDIAALSPTRLLRDLESSATEACGGGPICAVMHAGILLGADRARILHTSNSGDVTGDTSRVVGYISAAFLRTADTEITPE
ncbi:MAG: AmmeMemoRadiSam system protein B [Bacteroidota bacterium]|nr:AmmeMemoRadiSam system protein B [Bacteroidota bacterium]